MAEFADVFDPAGDPQKAMVGMMQVCTCLGQHKHSFLVSTQTLFSSTHHNNSIQTL
jgi:hypothetical protein